MDIQDAVSRADMASFKLLHFLLREAESCPPDRVGQANRIGGNIRLNVQRPTPARERRRICIRGWMFDVRGLPRRSFWRRRVQRFLLPNGRVAESGLRHSTRNRAWGNPPWVRIPPLPPSIDFRCFVFRWFMDADDRNTICKASFHARRRPASDRRFARRQMDVDSRNAFAILSAVSARNVAP